MLPIVRIPSTETLTKAGITVSDLEFSSVAIRSASEKHTSIIKLAVHGLTIWRETISIFSRWSLGLLYLITNRRLHVSFSALKTSWCCEAAGNEIDMPGRGQVFQKPTDILFFFFFLQTSIFLHKSRVVCCQMIFFFKKARKIGNGGDSMGKRVRVCLRFPEGNKKSFSLTCVIFIYISFPLCFFIYTVCGVGGKNHLHQHLRLTPGAKQWYFIPYHSEGHYLSTTSVPSSSRDLTYTHSHTHVNAITWQNAHTIHFHPASIMDSILCKAGTEVQVGRGKWRGGTFPEGVSWYVIVLVSTQ